MAEGLLHRLLAHAGVGASVGSAGLLPGGSPATHEAIVTMAHRRVDLRGHQSRLLTSELAQSTPLIIGMTRQHVRETCASYGAPIDRTFTLKELVRRGEEVGARIDGESVYPWLARVAAGRRPADLMGDAPEDDIADPVGRPRSVFEDLANELEDQLRRFVVLLAGGPPRSAAYADGSRLRGGVIRRADDVAAAPGTGTGYSRR